MEKVGKIPSLPCNLTPWIMRSAILLVPVHLRYAAIEKKINLLHQPLKNQPAFQRNSSTLPSASDHTSSCLPRRKWSAERSRTGRLSAAFGKDTCSTDTRAPAEKSPCFFSPFNVTLKNGTIARAALYPPSTAAASAPLQQASAPNCCFRCRRHDAARLRPPPPPASLRSTHRPRAGSLLRCWVAKFEGGAAAACSARAISSLGSGGPATALSSASLRLPSPKNHRNAVQRSKNRYPRRGAGEPAAPPRRCGASLRRLAAGPRNSQLDEMKNT